MCPIASPKQLRGRHLRTSGNSLQVIATTLLEATMGVQGCIPATEPDTTLWKSRLPLSRLAVPVRLSFWVDGTCFLSQYLAHPARATAAGNNWHLEHTGLLLKPKSIR